MIEKDPDLNDWNDMCRTVRKLIDEIERLRGVVDTLKIQETLRQTGMKESQIQNLTTLPKEVSHKQSLAEKIDGWLKSPAKYPPQNFEAVVDSKELATLAINHLLSIMPEKKEYQTQEHHFDEYEKNGWNKYRTALVKVLEGERNG